MQTTGIIIIGGGLSGLHAAFLRERKGLNDFVLLEGRQRLGGRVLSVPMPVGMGSTARNGGPEAPSHRADLGPSWYWPGVQPELDRLIAELGLQRFEQHETGDMLIERAPVGPPARMPGYLSAPPAMRLSGGMAALVDALHQRIDPARIALDQTVRRIRCTGDGVEVDAEDAGGRITTWCAERALLALPPRLALERIEFTPALPAALTRAWQETATWMAPHAKYVAVFDAPFWRAEGLSGEARSARGPMAEIHDASVPGGSGALFGFLGVPARVRREVGETLLMAHCRAQLVRLFGPVAGMPRAEFLQDWSREPFTATDADLNEAGTHPEAPEPTPSSGPWIGRLTGIGSEWSKRFPGYVAGAIDASQGAAD